MGDRGATYGCRTCGSEYEARSEGHAAQIHNDEKDHPFVSDEEPDPAAETEAERAASETPELVVVTLSRREAEWLLVQVAGIAKVAAEEPDAANAETVVVHLSGALERSHDETPHQRAARYEANILLHLANVQDMETAAETRDASQAPRLRDAATTEAVAAWVLAEQAGTELARVRAKRVRDVANRVVAWADSHKS